MNDRKTIGMDTTMRLDLAHDRVLEPHLGNFATKLRILESSLSLDEDPVRAVYRLPAVEQFAFGASLDHVVNVSALSGEMCEMLGLSHVDRAMIQIAAIFHDIGKIAIAEEILSKPQVLNDDERREVMKHVTIGRDLLLLGKSCALKLAAQAAYSHHERWDGTGYPERLSGEAIPLAARVVALADVYDALTSARPYHRALNHEEALNKIQTELSSGFDPRLLALFCEQFPDAQSVSIVQNTFRCHVTSGAIV